MHTEAVAWWDGVDVAERAPLAEDVHADVCVVGLGGSGLAAVREARALGARVIGVDAGRIAGAAAGRNGGLLLGGLAPFHHDAADAWGAEPATTLYRHTLEELARLRADTPHDTWWHGSLRIAEHAEERRDCERQLEVMTRDGLPVTWYEGAEGVGLRFPADGACQPVRRVLSLAARAEHEGAALHERSRVCAVHPGAVELANGACVHAPVIVVCADGALASLLPAAASRVRAVRLPPTCSCRSPCTHATATTTGSSWPTAASCSAAVATSSRPTSTPRTTNRARRCRRGSNNGCASASARARPSRTAGRPR
jgi:glycine/D-amino acid oxidase-like deaminating enzyme